MKPKKMNQQIKSTVQITLFTFFVLIISILIQL
jgi:hypothetical protein